MASRKLLPSSSTAVGIPTSIPENQNSAPSAALIIGKQQIDTLALAGNNKNLIRRTRNALGDIGNRLTSKGPSGTNRSAKGACAATVNGDKKTTTGSGTAGKTNKVPIPTNATTAANSPAKFVIPNLPPQRIPAATGGVGTSVLQQRNNVMTSSFSSSFKGITDKLKKPNRTQSFRTLAATGSSGTTTNATKIGENVRKVNPCSILKKPTMGVSATGDWKLVEKGAAKKETAMDVSCAADVTKVKVTATTTEPVQSIGVVVKNEDEVEILSEAFSLQRFTIRDIDANDVRDTCVPLYVNDIANYLFKLEKKFPVSDNYLNGRVINGRMRAVLMDWIVEVHAQFGYYAETLYMTAKTLDRFLQVDNTITRTQLQLAGMTALLLSAKFEEVNTPNMHDYTSVSDNAFTNADLVKMEGKILKAIQFDLSPPQPVFFLRRCSKAANVTSAQSNLHELAKYIMELSIIEYSVVHLFPSQIAAGAFGVASMVLLNKPAVAVWTPTLEHYTHYSFEDLKPIFRLLTHTLARPYEIPTKLQAVTNKFSRTRCHRISKIPEVVNVGLWKERILAELGPSSVTKSTPPPIAPFEPNLLNVPMPMPK